MISQPRLQRTPPVVRARRAGTVALTVLASAVLLGACGSKSSKSSTTNLNTARVARSIEQSILVQRHLTSSVACPAVVPQEKGKTFECIATTRTTKPPIKVGKTTFVVTVQSSKGYVTYAGK